MRNKNIAIFVAGIILGMMALAGCANDPLAPDKPCTNCPQLAPPGPNFCPNGNIVGGGTDACGCQLPPKCEALKVCTQDAKLCEDGTALERDPENDCEFPACPNEANTEKKYVNPDPEECKLILFTCEGGLTPFFDENGCGCEPASQ